MGVLVADLRHTHLRVVRPGEEVDEDQQREKLRPFSLNVMNSTGKSIFWHGNLSNFGALPHLDQSLYGDFFVADEWIEKNLFKRLFVRPSADAIVVCGRSEDDQGRAIIYDYPSQEVELKVNHSFVLMNNDGGILYQMADVANWHFLIEIDPKGHPRALAIDQFIGTYLRRTCILAGNNNTVLIEGIVTF